MELFGLPFSYVIFWAGAVATFVASVMAEEQNDRLRKGTFGAIAGSTMGGLAALLTKQEQLLVIGFFGSSMGGLAGWLISVTLSLYAAKTKTGRTMLDYQIGGWKAVRASLDLKDNEQLLAAMSQWSHNFIRQINWQKETIITQQKSAVTNHFIHSTIRDWLVSITNVLGLFFDLAEKEKYRSRAAIIIYGKNDNKEVNGKYWVAEAAGLKAHKTSKVFDDKSIAFKVLTEEAASPYFTTGAEANKSGQDRGKQSYFPFYTFRLNRSAVLTLDWHEDLKEDNIFIKEAKDLFNNDICPMIRDLLEHWAKDIQSEVGLQPL